MNSSLICKPRGFIVHKILVTGYVNEYLNQTEVVTSCSKKFQIYN